MQCITVCCSMMVMIACITTSSLVPLIEGLCSSDSISIQVLGLISVLYTNTHMPRFSPYDFFGPSRCFTLPARIPHEPVAYAPMQQCRNFFTMESIANLFWVLCKHPAGCGLPPTLASPPTVFTNPVAQHCSLKKIRPNSCYLLTRSPLRCLKSNIRSSALVQVSSSLSMGRTCAWPRSSSIKEFYFCHGFRGPFSKWLSRSVANILISASLLVYKNSLQSLCAGIYP